MTTQARQCRDVFREPRIAQVDAYMDRLAADGLLENVRRRVIPLMNQIFDKSRPSLERVFAQKQLREEFDIVAAESRETLLQAGVRFTEREVLESLGDGPPQKWTVFVLDPHQGHHWANRVASSLKRRFGFEFVADPIELAIFEGAGLFNDQGTLKALPSSIARDRAGGVVFHELMHGVYEAQRRSGLNTNNDPVHISFRTQKGVQAPSLKDFAYREFMSFEEVTTWAATLQMHAQALLRWEGFVFSDQFMPDRFLGTVAGAVRVAEAARFVAKEGLRTLQEGSRDGVRYSGNEIRILPRAQEAPDLEITIHYRQPPQQQGVRFFTRPHSFIRPEIEGAVRDHARHQLERATAMAEFTLQYFAGYESLPIHELVLRASRFRKEQRRFLRSLE